MVQELNFQAFNDRIPPQNIDAEESILGGILLDPEAITRLIDLLPPDALYSRAHQEIYRAMLTLHNQGSPTDLMSVTSWLKDQGLLEKAGGQGKLVQLVDRTVSAVNIDQYALLVMDKYMRRRLIQAGNEISQLGHDGTADLEKILDQSEQKVFSVTQDRPQQGLMSASDILTHTFADIESRSLGMVLPGLSCGFYDLDAMTQGFQRSDLIIVAGRPSMGKCVAWDTEIVRADGSMARIEEIYRDRQVQLLTLGSDWKLQATQPSAFVDDGIKPVFRVITRLGRAIETTLTHPYLTIQGWQQLANLNPGDKIAVPRQIPIFGSETLREVEVKLLSYLIGNSSRKEKWLEFAHSNPLVQQEFRECLAEFGEFTLEEASPSHRRIPTFRMMVSSDPVRMPQPCLDLSELAQPGCDRAVPASIFKLERSQVALFLNRLFATCGWATVLATGQSQVGFATASERIARQVQHLLLRFGVIASLKPRSLKSKRTQRVTWQLDITDATAMKTFIAEIGIFGKEATLTKVQAALMQRKYQTNRDLIPIGVWQQLDAARGSESWQSLAMRAGIAGHSNIHVGKRSPTRERLFALATALGDENLQRLATSDVYWDEIVSIEPVGDKQVYDLTIPETHNFVANDVCVHNTSFVLNVARNIASYHKLPVAVFSLEMAKEQLIQRLLASEVRIESGRLRAGRISQPEWEPLGHAISTLSQLPVFIDDTPNISINEMRSKARRLQAEKGGALGLILLDYLQLMDGGSDNRVQELSRITRSLKGLARELSVPIIALSQLSRGVESRTNKRPMMSDLRESGAIEQDADLIMMLYRDEYYNPDTPDRGIAEVIISKHRNGPTGTVKLLFESQFTQFRNLASPNRG